MIPRADSVQVAYPLFREEGGGSIPTLALLCKEFQIDKISFEIAKRCNRAWHSRLPRIGDPKGTEKAMICYGAFREDLLFAVAIWSHPVNRSLPQDTWIELRRMAIGPQGIKNLASWMLAKMTRFIKRARPQLLVALSYHDLGVHSGTIYKAAGWMPTTITVNALWSNSKRTRPKEQATGNKLRWEKML